MMSWCETGSAGGVRSAGHYISISTISRARFQASPSYSYKRAGRYLDDGPLKATGNARSTNPRLREVLVSGDLTYHLVEGTLVPFPLAIPKASTNFILERGESTQS